MSYFKWISLAFILFISVLSCRQLDKNPELYISLKEEVTDTVPFCPHVWSAELSDSISKNHPDFPHLDSLQIGKFDFLQYTYDEKQEVLPKMNNSILVLKYIENGKKRMGLDANNDGKIQSTEMYDMNPDKTGYIKIENIEQYINEKIENKTFYIRPIISRIFSKSGVRKNINRTIDFLIMPTYKLAEHNFKGIDYKIAIFPPSGNFRKYGSKYSKIFIKRSDEPFLNCTAGEPLYKIGDTAIFNQTLFILRDLDIKGEYILLDSIGVIEGNIGINTGDNAYDIKGVDVLSSKNITSSGANKYLLLDFWGTWCKPCLELTDQLKDISRAYSGSDFEIIGIAYDDSEEKVKNYLLKKQVLWKNIFDAQSNSIITEKYKVVSFPTFILIDPQGQIVMRGTSKETLDKVNSYLQSKITRVK